MGRDHSFHPHIYQHILILYIILSSHHSITSSSFILLYRFIIIFSIYDYWLKLRRCPRGKPRPFTRHSRRCRFHKQEIQFGIIKWRRLWEPSSSSSKARQPNQIPSHLAKNLEKILDRNALDQVQQNRSFLQLFSLNTTNCIQLILKGIHKHEYCYNSHHT